MEYESEMDSYENADDILGEYEGGSVNDGDALIDNHDIEANEEASKVRPSDKPGWAAFAEPDDTDEKDPAEGLGFSAPVQVEGEVLVPLNKLSEWQYHQACGSRSKVAKWTALLASAADPMSVAPITLLRKADGAFVIIDGRQRFQAFEQVHGANSAIEVRATIFAGTEADAVQWACDATFGCAPRSKIEEARAIYNVQRVAEISQQALLERYPVLNKDKVSRMTIAARTVERFPTVFNLLKEPDRVSLDLCVKFAQFIKGADEEERLAVFEEVERLTIDGTLLQNNEVLEALGIESESDAPRTEKPNPLAPSLSTDIFGADDQPVGALEMLADDVQRLRLPDPATMTADEREAAAEAFIGVILSYFGLAAGQ